MHVTLASFFASHQRNLIHTSHSAPQAPLYILCLFYVGCVSLCVYLGDTIGICKDQGLPLYISYQNRALFYQLLVLSHHTENA